MPQRIQERAIGQEARPSVEFVVCCDLRSAIKRIGGSFRQRTLQIIQTALRYKSYKICTNCSNDGKLFDCKLFEVQAMSEVHWTGRDGGVWIEMKKFSMRSLTIKRSLETIFSSSLLVPFSLINDRTGVRWVTILMRLSEIVGDGQVEDHSMSDPNEWARIVLENSRREETDCFRFESNRSINPLNANLINADDFWLIKSEKGEEIEKQLELIGGDSSRSYRTGR